MQKKQFFEWWPFRILLPSLLVVLVFVGIVFGIVLPEMGQKILEREKENAQTLTDTAWSVLSEYYIQAQRGELTQQEAQDQAAGVIRGMRYGPEGQDYFWINDFTPQLIVHPYRPDLEGQDLTDFRDPDGKAIFLEFVEAVRDGGDYVEYRWQFHEDTSQIVPKISYVRSFEPWDWIIGTGLYLDEAQAVIDQLTRQITMISMAGLFVVVSLNIFVISRSLETERKRRIAEENLQYQYAFLENVIESIPHPFMVVGAKDYQVRIANSATGKRDFAEGENCYCITHDQNYSCQGEEHLCPLNIVAKTKKPVTVEHIHFNEDGSQRFFEVHGYPIFDDDGNVVQMIEYKLDITPRKQAELTIREKEEQFRILYERAPISYQSLDEDGRFLMVNQTWLDVMGYSREEVIGQWFGDFLSKEALPNFRKNFPLFKAVGKINDVQFDMLQKDGTKILVSFNGRIGHDASGNFQQTHCVFEDITERKRAEEALRASERRYREVSELMSDFAYSLGVEPDGQYVVEWFTDSLRRIAEIPEDATLDLESFRFDLLHPDDLEIFEKRFENYNQNKTADSEYRIITGTGIVRWLRDYGRPIWDDKEDRLVRIVGAAQDITERKFAEEALKESEERYKSLFEESYSPMLLIDPDDAAIIDVNYAACEFYGYDVAEFKHKSFFDLNLLSDQVVLEKLTQAKLEQCNHFIFEHAHSNQDTSHVEVYCGPIKIEGRDLLYAIIHDISKRIYSQEENLRLAAAIEQANELILIADTDGNITYVNPYFEEVTGYSRREVIGKNPRFLKSGLQTESFYKNLWETIRSGKTWSGQFINRRKDGSLYNEASIIFPVKDSSGNIINYAAVKRDITEQIKAEENIQRQLRRLSTLRSIDTAISASLDLKLILEIIIDQTIKELNVDAAAIMLYDSTLQRLDLTAWQGFNRPINEPDSLLLGESLAGNIVLNREPIFLKDFRQVSSHKEHILAKINDIEKFMAYCGVPLIIKGELKGVLEVFHRNPLDFGQEWRDFLETLAGQTAIAVENSHLFERLQTANMELTMAYDNTLEGWAKALELRDQETKGHSDNVTEITLRMMQLIGAPSSQLVHIRRGALLHDIGKMGIPDSVLLKPGPLTDEEWEIMRKHPVYAYELLSSIDFLKPALDIPYCHHERWDGSGYPRGLKGEEIPLAARVFAIVDAWEALSSDRPYRKAWPASKVNAYIRAQSGILFDPNLVEIFLNLLQQGRFEFN